MYTRAIIRTILASEKKKKKNHFAGHMLNDLLIIDFYQTIKFPFAECMGEALNVYMTFPVDDSLSGHVLLIIVIITPENNLVCTCLLFTLTCYDCVCVAE